ncbi:MAG: GNAT family N-acetyltransferase [Candidatus Limnocylindrales bacterium]
MDQDLGRRLAVHEAHVHARSNRELRDLGDGVLLYDPADPEPFWNRLVAPVWPDDADGFDRRLDEVMTLFATLGRMPHIRTLPLGGCPHDTAERLTQAGFRLIGRDRSMALADPGPVLSLSRTLAQRPSLRLEHVGAEATSRAMDVARVLVEAFGVETDRISGLAAETLAAARRPGGAALLLLEDDRPVAAARRVTLEGATYLSSIGTIPAARDLGYASLLTAIAARDALQSGTEIVHLLADAETDSALQLYLRLGFEPVGEPIADLLAR